MLGCWESCRKENKGIWVEALFSCCFSELGLVECEVLSITVDNWKWDFFLFTVFVNVMNTWWAKFVWEGLLNGGLRLAG